MHDERHFSGLVLRVTECDSHKIECMSDVCTGQAIDSLRRAMMALSRLNHDVWEEVREICSEHHEVLKKHHDPAACGTAGHHRMESTGAGIFSSTAVVHNTCFSS